MKVFNQTKICKNYVVFLLRQLLFLLFIFYVCFPLYGQEGNVIDFEFQMEHTKYVNAIAFSPDGKRCATGGNDRVIKLWDVETGKLLKTLRGHKRAVSALQFSQDGAYLFSGEKGSVKANVYTIKKWNLQTREIEKESIITGMIKSIQVSPKGKYILLELGTILWTTYEVRDAENLKINKKLTGYLAGDSQKKDLIKMILKSFPLAKYKLMWGNEDDVIAGYGKTKIKIWSFKNKQEPSITILKPNFKVMAMGFGSENTIFLGGAKGELEAWNFLDEKEVKSLPKKHKGSIVSIIYNAENNRMISQDINGTLYVWNAESGDFMADITDANTITVYQEVTPNGDKVFSASANGEIRVWDRYTTELIAVNKSHSSAITKLIPINYLGNKFMVSYDQESGNICMYNTDGIKVTNCAQNQLNFKENNANGVYQIKIKITNKTNSLEKPLLLGKGTKLSIGKYHFVNKTIKPTISPDGKWIATVTTEGVNVREMDNLAKITPFEDTAQLIIKTNFYEADIEKRTAKHKESYQNQLITYDLNGQMVKRNLEGETIRNTPTINATNWVTAISDVFDKNQLITGSRDGTIKIWDLGKGQLLNSFKAHQGKVNEISYHPSGKWMASAGADGLKVWGNFTEDEQKKFEQKNIGAISSVKFYPHPDSTIVVSSGLDNKIIYWNFQKEKNESRLTMVKAPTPFHSIDFFLKEGQMKMIGASETGVFQNWTWQSKNLIKNLKWKGLDKDINDIFRIPKIGIGLSKRVKKGISVIQTHPNFKEKYYAEKNSPMMEGIWLLFKNPIENYYIRDYNGIKLLGKHDDEITCMDVSPDGKYLVSGSKDKKIIIWNTETKRREQILGAHLSPITTIRFSKDGQYFFSTDEDNRIKVWNFNERKVSVTLFSKNQGYIIYKRNIDKGINHDNYYLSSLDGAHDIHFIVNDTSIYEFEQFDLIFNRPDKLLETLGMSNKDFITALRNAYEKRKSLNVYKEFDGIFHAPKIRILNREILSQKTNKKEYSIYIKAKDEKYKLKQLNVYVNNVPIYGKQGKALNTNSLEKELSISLANGKNKIQVSVLNELGIASVKETITLTYEGNQSKPNLYLIGLGASKFSNEESNLDYTEKDIDEMLKLFKQQGKKFEKIYTCKLFNTGFTIDSLNSLKKYLKENMQINDQIIIFIANHGLLKNSDYYFPTSTTDFSEPSKGGISLEQINSLFDEIPALKRLLLIDACYSGELDLTSLNLKIASDSLININLKNKNPDSLKNVKFRSRIVSSNGANSELDLPSSFDLMKHWFADLRRGSGASIIASSKGTEQSIEGENWGHGIFTYFIKKGLENMEKHDTPMNILQLHQYVSENVFKHSEGKQSPNFRQQNLVLADDFIIWHPSSLTENDSNIVNLNKILNPPKKMYGRITKETSLRKQADSKSKVLKRLPANKKIEILDFISENWWTKVQISSNGIIGWVRNSRIQIIR